MWGEVVRWRQQETDCSNTVEGSLWVGIKERSGGNEEVKYVMKGRSRGDMCR